ncbi:MAG TPA: ATP-binding protein [Candidatus Binatia bacterium]|nr:ATP-binding protein [Candidatus Binatia bacterium]
MTPRRISSSRSVVSATSSIPTRWSRRLVLQFVAPTLAALGVALLAAVPYVAVTLERHQLETLGERLLAEAQALGDAIAWEEGAALDASCARLARDLGVRVTVIAADGRVLGESTRSSESMENHANRPEVREALATGRGRSIRESGTVGTRLLYAATRQTRNGEVRIVRTSLALTAVEASLAHVRRLLFGGIAVAALVGLAVALVLSRRMLRRIQRLVAFARRVAAGEPPPYLGPERADDLGVLEEQLGEMATRITRTIGSLRVEQERLEAILRGMVEGVLVTDLVGAVVLVNARARELLDVPADVDAGGRPLIELVRDPALAELAHEVRTGAAIVSRDVVLGGGRTIQVNAAPLRDPDGAVFGFVLVLHDVTELRRLEVVRRDFVANVSHELRTPLTAIKGYAETLLGPAGDDRETARRFLEVIDRHSERLGRLIDDLLALSDLELGLTEIAHVPVAVGPTIDDVVDILRDRAARARVAVAVAVEPGTPPALGDGDRLRQVLINLVDNAIKYTPEHGRVVVRAAPAADGMVAIAVEDTGIGIPARDLPRLTERFFRVDKARSRALGGTGLGLAIVKHLVHAHGGSLAIASTLGAGTTVTVQLPAAERGPMPQSAAGA